MVLQRIQIRPFPEDKMAREKLRGRTELFLFETPIRLEKIIFKFNVTLACFESCICIQINSDQGDNMTKLCKSMAVCSFLAICLIVFGQGCSDNAFKAASTNPSDTTSSNEGGDNTVNSPPNPTQNIDYVHFSFKEGSGSSLTSEGFPSPFPLISLKGTITQLWSVADKLTITSTGNPSDRIYGNAIIDNMMRLDDLTGTYKCKYFSTHIRRHFNTTGLSGNERIFQYGDQGSGAGLVGGWVARINSGSSAPFLSKSLSFAIHTPDLDGKPKPGGQNDPDFPDPIASTPVFSDSDWEQGLSVLFAVDNSVSPYTVRIYVNGVLSATDEQSDLTWPLPGISNNGPGTDASSNGFVLFAQSTNQGTSPLKDAEVSDIWIGRAIDTNHLNEIALKLYQNIKLSPY